MALGLRGRLNAISTLIAPTNRYKDIALQFEVNPTGERFGANGSLHGVFGGVWDAWGGCYTDDCPSEVLVLPCSALQRAFILDESKRVLGKGGRGGGTVGPGAGSSRPRLGQRHHRRQRQRRGLAGCSARRRRRCRGTRP